MTTKIFAHKELEEKMEAKDQRMINLKDEIDFFILIERKLAQNGFEVLETLPLSPSDLPAELPIEVWDSQ